jgi:hypothetical protein
MMPAVTFSLTTVLLMRSKSQAGNEQQSSLEAIAFIIITINYSINILSAKLYPLHQGRRIFGASAEDDLLLRASLSAVVFDQLTFLQLLLRQSKSIRTSATNVSESRILINERKRTGG